MPVGPATVTALDKSAKVLYSDHIPGSDYVNSKFLAMCPRATDFKGTTFEQPIRYGKGQGGSAIFATGQANVSSTNYEKFSISRKKSYWFARIDNETLDALDGSVGSIVAAGKEEIENARDEFVRFMGILSWGSGNGALTTIKSTTTLTTTTIACQNVSDIYRIQPDMILNFSSGGTVATLRDGGETRRVTGVDELAGTFTVDTAPSPGIVAIATGDYVHREGDVGACITGVAGYVPGTHLGAPAALHGCTRSTYATRLAGYGFSGSGKNMADAFLDGIMVHKAGANPGENIFMSSIDMGTFIKQLDAKGIRTDRAEIQTKVAGVMYEGIKVFTPGGTKTIIDDPNLTPGTAYNLEMKRFKLKSLGAFPRFLNRDKSTWYMMHTADMLEARMGFYGDLVCDYPGDEAVYTSLAA